MPATTAVLGAPFEPEFELRAFEPAERDEALRLPEEELRPRDDELPPRADELRPRADELRPRDDAAEDRRLDALAVLRLDALALFGLLREAEDLLREAEDLLREPDGLDPFEVVDPDFRLVWERDLAWAIAPP
jgi:hypothetical protein